MQVTMEDIARECGVTKMTVSRVLSGREGVKATTRENVLAVAARMNYEINTLAQNFNTNRSGFIGVATPFDGLLGSSYFEEVFKGFRRALKSSDLDFALFDTGSELFNDGAKLKKLYAQRRVDGLLIVALHTTDNFLDTLERLGIPMVVVGERPTCPTTCSVSCKDERGIELVCEHLYSLGHRKIAFIEGPRDFATADRRKAAFLAFAKRKKLSLPPHFIQPGDFTMRSGRIATRLLLSESARPTAIIAANDIMAFGAIDSAHEIGVRVPQDVSIAGFDDLTAAADRFPSVTTVHQPVSEMGERGARMLVEAIGRRQVPSGHTVMDVSLVVRESTAPPAKRGSR